MNEPLMNKLKTKTEITRHNIKHARRMQIANAKTDRRKTEYTECTLKTVESHNYGTHIIRRERNKKKNGGQIEPAAVAEN